MEITNYEVAEWLLKNKDKIAIVSSDGDNVVEISRVIPSMLEGTLLIETQKIS